MTVGGCWSYHCRNFFTRWFSGAQYSLYNKANQRMQRMQLTLAPACSTSDDMLKWVDRHATLLGFLLSLRCYNLRSVYSFWLQDGKIIVPRLRSNIFFQFFFVRLVFLTSKGCVHFPSQKVCFFILWIMMIDLKIGLQRTISKERDYIGANALGCCSPCRLACRGMVHLGALKDSPDYMEHTWSPWINLDAVKKLTWWAWWESLIGCAVYRVVWLSQMTWWSTGETSHGSSFSCSPEGTLTTGDPKAPSKISCWNHTSMAIPCDEYPSFPATSTSFLFLDPMLLLLKN